MSEDDRRTLYASGFPNDIHYREVRNIFLFQPGFEYCRLVENGRVPIVFATFVTQSDAMACKDRMHGARLEEESTVELRLELAKSSRPHRDNSRKRFAGSAIEGDVMKRPRPAEESSTVYFYGLSPDTQESEIKDLLKGLQGFMRHRWSPSKRPGGTPVAYADFSDAGQAKAALQALNGASVSTVPNGICVRYADAAPPSSRSRDRPSTSRAPPSSQYYPYPVQGQGQAEVYGGYPRGGQMPPAGYPDSYTYGQFNPYGPV